MKDDAWIKSVETKVKTFSKKFSLVYSKTSREISASFEIGCFHALVDFYQDTVGISPQNLTANNEFRYLTSPNGNPNNFSYLRLVHETGNFELRQQVRIKSHLNPDIAFTPDLVIIPEGAAISATKDKDYASGKRSFFTVQSKSVIAAHECKSMNPFPELLVSFIGMLIAAHAWFDSANSKSLITKTGIHLAPSLFVGGTARALHRRMVEAMEDCFPANIILGLHYGTWNLKDDKRLTNKISKAALSANGSKSD